MNLTFAEIEYQTSHIHDDKRLSIIVAVSLLSILVSVAVLSRIFVRIRSKAGTKGDDYTILFAWVLSWGFFVDIYYGPFDFLHTQA